MHLVTMTMSYKPLLIINQNSAEQSQKHNLASLGVFFYLGFSVVRLN